MKWKHPLLQKSLGLAGAAAAVAWRATIDWKAVYFDPTADPVHPRFLGRCVYATWHESLLTPALLRGERRILALASEHGDGEIVTRALKHLGWSVARGSTTRGGAAVLLRMLRGDHRMICITPDGPRGPRRHFSHGPLFLASKLGLPLICIGYGFDRPWRLRSWDRFAIPRPFSRGRAVFGPPLRLPERLDRVALERHAAFFQKFLTALTDDAEEWATSGQRRPGEIPILPGEPAAGIDRPRPVVPWPAWAAAEWAELSKPRSAAA